MNMSRCIIPAWYLYYLQGPTVSNKKYNLLERGGGCAPADYGGQAFLWKLAEV